VAVPKRLKDLEKSARIPKHSGPVQRVPLRIERGLRFLSSDYFFVSFPSLFNAL